jgi:hypothetical protein
MIIVTTFTDPGIIPRRPFLLYQKSKLKMTKQEDSKLSEKLDYFLY